MERTGRCAVTGAQEGVLDVLFAKNNILNIRIIRIFFVP